jgi:hypothetical protein
MSDRAIASPTTARRVDPQRLAWGVLLLAFAIFCAICIVTAVGVNYLLFRWPMPMDALLSAGRGTVVITQPTGDPDYVRDAPKTLSQNTDVSTDPSSQGMISFIDTSAGNRVIATVTVKNNSSLLLNRSDRPRFEWSNNSYLMEFTNVFGQFDVHIAEDVQRPIRIMLSTRQDTLVDLDAGGNYVIDVTDAGTHVFNRNGSAKLFLEKLRSGLVIPPGGQGVVSAGGEQVELAPGYTEVLLNSNFRELNRATTGQLLAGWVCGNDPDDNPRGSFRSQLADGFFTLRLERFDNATSHGRTSCLQSFGQGIDPYQYDYLTLRARFMIHYQSLAVCGSDGSECPLMLRMDYIDTTGKPQIWYHGFFATPNGNFPLRCVSCLQEHERVNAGTWYTYESGNLLNLFTEDRKPASIINLWFYASGHQYDVQVSEVALLAGAAPQN